jgi:hypothetical protein
LFKAIPVLMPLITVNAYCAALAAWRRATHHQQARVRARLTAERPYRLEGMAQNCLAIEDDNLDESKGVLYGGGLRSNKQQNTCAYRRQQDGGALMIVTPRGRQPCSELSIKARPLAKVSPMANRRIDTVASKRRGYP